MDFEELDETTRSKMLLEFDAEETGAIPPYRGRNLSASGAEAFPSLMREAILHGNEETLATSLKNSLYWVSSGTTHRGGVVRLRDINYNNEADRLGLTEFNTWYVRGLAKRLIDEGEKECQIYRAAYQDWHKQMPTSRRCRSSP